MSPRQTGGFLNRYHFSYAGRDTVNEVGKIAPGILGNLGKKQFQKIKKKIGQVRLLSVFITSKCI